MEEDEFSQFLITRRSKNVKSYSNKSRKDIKSESDEEKTKTNNLEVKQALTTKKAVEFLLAGSLKSKVCRCCLNISASLYELDQVFQIGSQEALYKVTVRDMIAHFYPIKLTEDSNFPNKICDNCLNTSISSYLFTQQCERSGRALRNCFEDMYEKLEKLDPLDRTKKRGRQKLNPNHNTLYTEHEKVINYADSIYHLINRGVEITEENKNEINELECPKCAEVLPNIESLFNHEKIHPKSMWFNCRICGQSFTKRHLYRKHIKSNHNRELEKPLTLNNTGFKCTDCGVASEAYDQHLQHIEKHKFNMVMEHLIERKMDKLCVICMGKGIKMVDLNKMISLHGGCPELTGQRSLYNILGSTMPEQNSYKYQELIMPCKAKILELIKKKNIKPSLEREERYNTKEFVLSNPIIISELDINCDDDYIFLFTKPVTIDKMITAEKENDIKLSWLEERVVNESAKCEENYEIIGLEISDNQLKNTTQENSYVQNEQYVYAFTKPETNVDAFPFETRGTIENDTINVEEEINDGGNKIKTCEKCWIFRKPCESCVRNTKFDTYIVNNNKSHEQKLHASNDNDSEENSLCQNEFENIIVSTTNNECKHCWIFKNTERCHYCKKENILFHVDVSGSKNTEKVNADIDRKKRKITPNIDYQPKKLKWQCNVCLTENAYNELCVCCDSKRYDNRDQIKILFGLNKHFLYNPKHPTDNNEEPFTETVHSNENIAILEDQKSLIDTSEIAKDEPNIKLAVNESNEANTVPLLNMENNDIITMDTEIGTQNHNEFEVKCNLQEEMDVEEACNDTSCKILNLNALSTSNFATTAKPALNFPTMPDTSCKILNLNALSTSNFAITAKPALNFPTMPESTSMFPTTTETTVTFATNVDSTPNFNFNIGTAPMDDKNKGGRRFKRPLRRLASTFSK